VTSTRRWPGAEARVHIWCGFCHHRFASSEAFIAHLTDEREWWESLPDEDDDETDDRDEIE
jgi:hypothetical protein